MEMMFSIAAALLSALWLLVHFFLGGREVADIIRDNDTLPPQVAAATWMCWHMVTATLAAMSAFFALGIWTPPFTIAGIVLAMGFAIVGIATAPLLRISYLKLPQGWLFLPVVLLGWLSL